MLGRLFEWWKGTPAAAPTAEAAERALPVLWLLGKTGAGKSSLVRLLTGLDAVAIGNGFAPCTRTSQRFDFPVDEPLVRFLDTRGLGESGYDPSEDLALLSGHAHAVVVVARLDDPAQGEVADVLARVARRERMPALLIHTAADLVPDASARERARADTAARFTAAAGRTLPEAVVALPRGSQASAEDREAVVKALLQVLPGAALALTRQEVRTAEQEAFAGVRGRVLFWAGLAGSTDVAPVVGLVSVPAAQIGMLNDLGTRYGVDWSAGTRAAFAGALGAGLAMRMGAGFGLRQLGKLVPVYGQTVGAAAAGGLSFATTFALGRAAAYFLHHRAAGEEMSVEDLRAVYARALTRAGHAGP
jgi:uncharacterized protein (DUF697 family)/energy-coupling factor transporter ATP-binding protein EcfA2